MGTATSKRSAKTGPALPVQPSLKAVPRVLDAGAAAAFRATAPRASDCAKVTDAEVAGLADTYRATFTPNDIRMLLGAFRAITCGTLVATSLDFAARLTVLYGLTPKVKHRFFNLCDKDGDGRVLFADFVRLLATCRSDNPAVQTQLVFSLYSHDGGTSLNWRGTLQLLRDASGRVTSNALAAELAELALAESELTGAPVTPIVHLTEDDEAIRQGDGQDHSKAAALFDPDSAPSATSATRSRPPRPQPRGVVESKEADAKAAAEADDDATMPQPAVPHPSGVRPLRVMAHGANFDDATASLARFRTWCASSSGPDLTRLLSRFDLTPDKDVQRDALRALLSSADLKEGDTWCLLSQRWWEAWVEFSGCDDDVGVTAARKGSASTAAFVRHTRHSVILDPSRVVVEDGVFAGVHANAGAGRAASRAGVASPAPPSPLQPVGHTFPTRNRSDGSTASSAAASRGDTDSPLLFSRAPRRSMGHAGDIAAPKPALATTAGSGSGSGSGSSSGSVTAVGTAFRPIRPDAGGAGPPQLLLVPASPTLPSEPHGLSRGKSFRAAAPRPGPIDNFGLQGSRPDLLRPNAAENHDYVLVPEAAWVQLMCWYGGGPTFPRRVVDLSGAASPTAALAPVLSPVGTRLPPGAAPPPAAAASTQLEVELWPRQLFLSFLLPSPTAPGDTPPADQCTFDVEVRVGSQRSWAGLLGCALQLHAQLSAHAAESPVDALPHLNGADVARAAVQSLSSVVLNQFRLHVQVNTRGNRLVLYRLDTRDPLEAIEAGFLAGGESLVVERCRPDGTWLCPSIKGDGLWTELEVGDHVDARDRHGVWRPGRVQHVDAAAGVARVKFEQGAGTLDVLYRSGHATDAAEGQAATMGDVAPYCTRSDMMQAVAVARGHVPAAPTPFVVESKAVHDDAAGGDVYASPARLAIQPVTVSRGSGAVGLFNVGNTCYMNATVQCLSHLPLLSSYLLSGRYRSDVNKDNPLGVGGKLVDKYVRLLADLWSSKAAAVNPIKFKVAIAKFAPQFAGYNQHDCQELLAFLLDGLHEEVNVVKDKPYAPAPDAGGRPDAIVAAESWQAHLKRNQSVVVDLFQGQLKSTMACPQEGCGHTSVTFDPFMYLSLPMPFETHRTVQVEFMPLRHSCAGGNAGGDWSGATSSSRRPAGLSFRVRLRVDRRAKVSHLVSAVAAEAGVPSNRLVVADVYQGRVYTTLPPRKRMSHVRDSDSLVVYQTDAAASSLLEVVQERPVGAPAAGIEAVRSPMARRRAGRVVWEACSMPIILSVAADTTSRQVHGQIQAQVSQVVPSDTTARPPYHVVGCPLPCDDLPLALSAEDAALHLRWTDAAWRVVKSPEPVPLVDDGAGTSTITLDNLLDGFCKEEVLDEDDGWYCSSCKAHRAGRKKLELYRAPRLLVLHLKRFAYQRNHREKICTRVSFRVEGMDLSRHVLQPELPTGDPGGAGGAHPPLTYDLVGVANHAGSLGSGHYTATCLNHADGEWYQFDDDHVDRVDPATAISGTRAYVLFYQRRDS